MQHSLAGKVVDYSVTMILIRKRNMGRYFVRYVPAIGLPLPPFLGSPSPYRLQCPLHTSPFLGVPFTLPYLGVPFILPLSSMTYSPCPLPWWPLHPATFLDDLFTLLPSSTSPFFHVPHPPCPVPSIPLPSYYIFTAFSRCFPFTTPYMSIIVKTAVIAALKQRTVLTLTSFFYYASIFPLLSPFCPSSAPTYT